MLFKERQWNLIKTKHFLINNKSHNIEYSCLNFTFAFNLWEDFFLNLQKNLQKFSHIDSVPQG